MADGPVFPVTTEQVVLGEKITTPTGGLQKSELMAAVIMSSIINDIRILRAIQHPETRAFFAQLSKSMAEAIITAME